MSTMRSTLAAIGAVLALQGAASCVSVRKPSFMEPASQREWPAALRLAHFRVSEGKFEAADTVLAEFANRFPGTSQAVETTYWRALIRMDPSNPNRSLPQAIISLDTYLADPHPRAHTREAAALRRVAAQFDEVNKIANALGLSKDRLTNAKPQPMDLRVDLSKAVVDTPTAADLEIRRLTSELAKATAELERIRKRLAQPPNKR